MAYLAVTEIRQRAVTAPVSQPAVPQEDAATEAGSGQETEAPQRTATAPATQPAVPEEDAAAEAGSGQEPEAPRRTATAPVSQSAVSQEGAATEADSGQEPEAPQSAITAPASQSAVPLEGAAKEAGSDQKPDASETPSTVIAYYFHGTRRCKTCLTIEAYADESLKAGFPQELETGRLTWRALNVEEPENEHFVRDFELATRSVVLVEVKNGKTEKWKSLDKVWKLVGDKEAFVAYIQKETADYLGL
ncbi:MAG: hypothetical protein JSV08_04315 [Acidobacteriota bacterium]|nr:MAG: hypothetical protein JSV08_04315 [Acidobacteriota bacterium]